MVADIRRNKVAAYIFLSVLGIVMVYPLMWLLGSSFKTNHEIFTSLGIFPKEVITDGFVKGWQGPGQFTYGRFFYNTFLMVLPTVAGTVISSAIVAYGFARFRFPFKRVLFVLMISQLMLPNAVIIIPRYMLFRSLGWLNTYMPFIIPALFATYSFFIFMMIQFVRGIPKELDESAYIDGCNSFTIFSRIMLPLLKPALFSAGIFQFIWRWNDFLNPLIYINSVRNYPLSLALRMSMDITEAVNWNQLMAMSLLTMIPPILIFFFAQRYFVEGISTTGIKG